LVQNQGHWNFIKVLKTDIPVIGIMQEVSFSDQTVELVEGGIDMALRIGAELRTNLIARPLCPIRLMCCASPDYLRRHGMPKTPDDLRRHACLTYSYAASGDTWRFVKDGREVTVQIKPSFRANSGDMIHLAVLAGQGIAVQPTFIIGDALRSGELVRVLTDHDFSERRAWVVYQPGSRRSARVQAFYELLRDAFGAGVPPWDSGLG
jgi:DNA-binding transcriptional LysR family regulator